MTRWTRGLVALTLGASVVQAQVPDAESSRSAMMEWLALVAGGGADDAWGRASARFQARIETSDWGAWVRNNRRSLAEASASRRVLEFTVGRDELPLPPVEWARGVFARDRQRGGRFLERVTVVREGGVWRVADFATWADGRALVTSGSVDAVPFTHGYDGLFLGGFYRGRFRIKPPPPDVVPPPPAGATAIANPRPTRQGPPD